MNTTLIWLLAIPICLGLVLFVLTRNKRDAHIPAGAFAIIGMLVVCLCFFISKGSKIYDTEIWNGQVVSKDRAHGTYEESYECRCKNVRTKNSDGSYSTKRVCDTCYRTHYTVTWTAETTVGEFQIGKLDRTTRRVYDEPDPDRYAIIKRGDPAAKEHTYVNYIQAVPNSLFTPAAADLKAKFAGLIPAYPDKIYDFYKVDRFVTAGWNVADAALWNANISNALRELGPKKQVNLIIVVAKTDDVNYEYALRDAWEGANKNDVVLIIGSTQYPKIDFVRVLSWTKNEAFKIQLRDNVMDLGTVHPSIVSLCAAHIEQNFQRRQMKEFEYLEGEIDPPDWLIFVMIGLLVVGAVGTCIFIQKQR